VNGLTQWSADDGTEDRARALDEADPLAGYRDRFHHPRSGSESSVYLCGHSLGLQPVGVADKMEQELKAWASLGVDAHFKNDDPWYEYHESLHAPLSRIVGAKPAEVVAMNGLTTNLHLMMVSFYRPQGKRRKILIEENAFPSDLYAVRSQIAFHGGDPDSDLVVASARPGESSLRPEDIESLIARDGDEIALVLFGGVNYFSGQAFPLQRIVAAARTVGAKVGFDLAHAAGNLELSLHDWGVDFAVWCSYKYLNSGPGGIGCCFVHERHADRDDLPRFSGWWGNDPATRFRMHLEDRFLPHPGADGWQLSNPSIFAMAPLKISMQIFDRATLPALREKSRRLTGYLAWLLEERLGERASQLTPADPDARGCQLSLRLSHGDPKSVFDALAQSGVTVDFRPPDVLRAAPVPLYNGFLDVFRFVDRLDRALQGG
jgi:kynureninase